NPLAYGMEAKLDVFFDNSPVFRLRPEASIKGLKPVAWFDSDRPLRSGWAWGQKYLQDGVAVAEARVGKGKLFLFGPEITFRGQPHGTFKFLFNGIYYGGAESVRMD
ncbi:MAG TPA: peptidase, partial [Blastocatellia bacterium]|nr:peptidase [Blastocatellia bacterium]